MNSVIRVNYSTSLDERGFIPVYEYQVNNQAILWDSEKGDVFLTGIWKALGFTKSDVIRTVKLNPGLETKKIRGGVLKIQGTWVPFNQARSLCIHTAWPIRYHLTPLFGSQFANDCLPPQDPRYRIVCLDSLQTPTTVDPSLSNLPIKLSQINEPSSRSARMLSYILNEKGNLKRDIQGTHPMNMTIVGATLASFVDTMDDKDDDTVPKDESTSQELKFKVIPVNTPRSVPYSSLLRHDLLNIDHCLVTCPIDYMDPSWSFSPSYPLKPPSPLTEPTTKPEHWTIEEMAEMIQATLFLQSIIYQDNNAFRQVAPSRVMVDGVEFSVVWE